MLAWLISAGQAILLYKSPTFYLFYRGEVYIRNHTEGILFLPRYSGMRYCPIWMLIDGDYKGQGPSNLGGNPDVWPIQATSPTSGNTFFLCS